MGTLGDKGRAVALPERVGKKRTALLVIDVQNEFCHADGHFGRLGADLSQMPAMADAIKGLLKEARRLGLLTVFVRATYDPSVVGAPLGETFAKRGFADSQCLPGSWDADWYGGIEPEDRPNEIALEKHRFGAFEGTDLDLVLRSNRIESVVFTGVVTSGCIDASARQAFFKDYYVTLATDGVADGVPENHAYSLKKLGQTVGLAVPSAEILNVWRGLRPNDQGLSRAAKGSPRDLAVRVAPDETALVLLDLAADAPPDAGKAAKALLDAARAAGVRIVHVRTETSDLTESDASLALPGSRANGGKPMPGFAPRAGEHVIGKHRSSAFAGTPLDLILRVNGVRTLVIAGLTSHGAVQSTVRDATAHDYGTVVPADAVSSGNALRHLHEASLEMIRREFGTTPTSLDIISAWSHRKAIEK